VALLTILQLFQMDDKQRMTCERNHKIPNNIIEHTIIFLEVSLNYFLT